jgi:hypothetical protein
MDRIYSWETEEYTYTMYHIGKECLLIVCKDKRTGKETSVVYKKID